MDSQGLLNRPHILSKMFSSANKSLSSISPMRWWSIGAPRGLTPVEGQTTMQTLSRREWLTSLILPNKVSSSITRSSEKLERSMLRAELVKLTPWQRRQSSLRPCSLLDQRLLERARLPWILSTEPIWILLISLISLLIIISKTLMTRIWS